MQLNFKPLTQKDLKALGAPTQLAPNSPKAAPATSPKDEGQNISKSGMQRDILEGGQLHPNVDGAATLSSNTYAGDLEDLSGSLHDGFERLEFKDPAELLETYDNQVILGDVTLHDWQREVSESFGSVKPTQHVPHKFALCACNGSGKDAYVIAPFAIWFALSKIKSRCIITSSSGVQLTSQTETYIRNLALKVNEKHGEEIFKIRQRFIRCRLTGSEIRLFATDEEGKAEGYHPIEAGAEMAIIINEAKSVAQEIFRALRRCTGYNYWLEVSTPSIPYGDFFKHFSRWASARRVDYRDCPHISEQERLEELEEFGEHSAWYRSKYLALFTSLDGDSFISLEVVDRARQMSKAGYIKWNNTNWPLRIGIDLAAGGDENACIATRGNRIVKKLYFREKDTTITAHRINLWLRDELNVQLNHNFIFADDGGVGRGIIDKLVEMGWSSISRILNQSPALNKKVYINRGAENWFRVKRVLEENCWLFPFEDDDEKLYQQLYTRFYKQQQTQGRIALESKKDAKAEGRPSPDRADAFILCFTGQTIDDFLTVTTVETPSKVPVPSNVKVAVADLAAKFEEEKWKAYAGEPNLFNSGNGRGKPIGRIFGNINSLFKRAVPNSYGTR